MKMYKEEEKKSKKKDIITVLAKSSSGLIFFTSLISLCVGLLSFSGPLLLKEIVEFM